MENLLIICVVLLMLMVFLMLALVALTVAKELRKKEWISFSEQQEERKIRKEQREADRAQKKEALREKALLAEVENYSGDI